MFVVGNLRFLVEFLVGAVLDQIEIVHANERLARKGSCFETRFCQRSLEAQVGFYLESRLELVDLLVKRIRLAVLGLHVGKVVK